MAALFGNVKSKKRNEILSKRYVMEGNIIETEWIFDKGLFEE